MRSWELLLLLLPAILASKSGEVEVPESEEEEEGDSAPFVVAVEHSNAWRCTGSLVSTKAVLTTAWCALGPPAAVLPAATSPTEWSLWALAGSRPRSAHAIRRVTSVALAHESRAEEPGANLILERWASWGGAENDIAVLELASAFGAEAHIRPIMLAAAEKDCGAAICHTVRGAGRGVLDIETLTRASAACAPIAPHWQTIRERAMCFKGPEFCPSEWGAAVICEGKLCGVLSRSARELPLNDSGIVRPHPTPGGTGGSVWDTGCGSVHAVLSVPRWRKFFDCAHTLRMCGKDKCAKICTERRLEESHVDQPRTELTRQLEERLNEDPRTEDPHLDERRHEDKFNDKRIDDSKEDSAENAIVPAAARHDEVHYEPREPPGINYQGYHPVEYSRYQPLIHLNSPSERQDYTRNFEPEIPRQDHAQRTEYPARPDFLSKDADFPSQNYNYPRDDVLRNQAIRNWTSYEQYERTKTTYEHELSTHVPFGHNTEDSPVGYDDIGPAIPFGRVSHHRSSPIYISSPSNVFPPPFASQPTYPAPAIFNSPPPPYVVGPSAPPQDPPRPPRTSSLAAAAGVEPTTAPPLVTRQREFEPYRSDFKRYFPASESTQTAAPPVPPPFEPVDASAARLAQSRVMFLLKFVVIPIYHFTI